MDEKPQIRVGGMVWRVGEMLDFYEQIAWFQEQGLDGIAFHTAPSFGGKHASFDVRMAKTADRERLKQAVAPFAEVSVHAEFDNYDIILCSPNKHVRRASVEALRSTIDLASSLEAPVVTVHDGVTRSEAPPKVRREALRRSVADLAELARRAHVTVGSELTDDFDLVLDAEGPVGVTLDVGHVHMHWATAGRESDSLGDLIRGLGKRLVHLHVHDWDGQRDHLAIGAGRIDFTDMVEGLVEIGYDGMLCLELSSDATVPADYPRSAEVLRSLIEQRQ